MKNSEAAKAPQDMFGVSVIFGVLGFLAAIVSLCPPHAFHQGAITVASFWMASAECLTTRGKGILKWPWIAFLAVALDSFRFEIAGFLCLCLLAVVLMVRWQKAWVAAS